MIGDVREVARAITRASEGVQGYQSTAEAPQSSRSTRRRSLDDDAIEEHGRRSPAWPDRLKSSNFRPALTYAVLFCEGDGGFGVEVIVPKFTDIDPLLLSLCAQLSTLAPLLTA